MRTNLNLTLCSLALAILVAIPSAHAQKTLAIKGGKILTMAGDTIENGTILFRDGVIIDVGTDLKIPVEAQVIEATGKVIMPGFIEAHSSSGMSQANETNQNVPYVSVIDSIDPMNSYFRRARRDGVTSVAITPGNSTMIGGQAAVIKTGGEFVDYMVLKGDAGIKISLRPVSGSRMGHLAKLRKAFEDAKEKMESKEEDNKTDDKADPKKADGKKNKKKDGADDKKKTDKPDVKEKADTAKTKTEAKTPAEKSLSELDRAMIGLLTKKVPAIIYCDQAMDVGQALRLIKEYDLDARLVLGRNCYKAAEQVAKSGLPVVLDSTLVFWEEDPRTKQEKKIVLTEAFRKHDVKFAFQASRGNNATLGSNYLWYQAATAVKYGMPENEALEALTILPAKMLGVDKFVGSIEKGKDGDVIILSGDPLKVGTWVETTIINGEIAYVREKDQQLQKLLGNSKDK